MPPVPRNSRRKISYIWNFFTEVDDVFAKCNLCKSKLSYRTSTTNLKKHFELKHPTVSLVSAGTSETGMRAVLGSSSDPGLEEAEAQLQLPATTNTTASTAAIATASSVSASGTSAQSNNLREIGSTSSCVSPAPPPPPTPIRITGPRQTHMLAYIPRRVTPKIKQTIDDDLLGLFTDSYQPFTIVEERPFRKFIRSLNPSYELPSRHMISRTLIPAKYEKCVYETRDALKLAKKVCATTDCWTSSNMESYMAVTVHFLNDQFQLISLLLECASLPVHHTAKNLANQLNRVLTEWDVKNRLLMVVSDNAANIKAAVQSELGWKHFGCFAHTLNLVANDGLKEQEVSKIIGKIKYIVGHFKRSHIATAKLLAYQQNQGCGNPLRLLQDVATRWNSTFYMLERFVLLEEAIKTTMALINMDATSYLSVCEWDVIRQLCTILKPLEKVTKTISGERYLTASLVIPLANGLISVFKGFEKQPLQETVQNVLKKLSKSMADRFDRLENSNTLSVATFLDPRFKQIPFKDKKNAESAKKNVLSLVSEKFAGQQNPTPATPDNDTIPSTSNANVAYIDPDSDDDVWAEFDKEAAQYKPNGTSTSKAIQEVQRYLDCDRHPRKEDPLQWWMQNKYMFPQLSQVAQERLSAIATSVPCERLFSKAGQILTERRTRLASDKLQMLLLLNTNSNSED